MRCGCVYQPTSNSRAQERQSHAHARASAMRYGRDDEEVQVACFRHSHVTRPGGRSGLGRSGGLGGVAAQLKRGHFDSFSAAAKSDQIVPPFRLTRAICQSIWHDIECIHM